jgi:uncharacterized protein with HEPN domain
MKDLRNTIAHEYIEDELSEVFEEVLEYSANLLEIIDSTTLYIEKTLDIKES